MKRFVPIVAPVVITLAILAAAWQFKFIPLGNAPGASAAPVLTVPAEIDYSMPERVVNLADHPGFRYLKIQVTLGFADSKHQAGQLTGDALKQTEDDLSKQIEPYRPAIDDYLITVLTAKTSSQLLSSDGKESLRAELLDGLRQRIPNTELRAVYFQQFVIQ